MSFIRKCWETELGYSDFGNEDGFFEVGGSSVNIVSLQQRISEKYDFVISTLKELSILQCLDPSPEEELEKLAKFLEPNFVYNNKRSHEKRASNTEKKFKENYVKKEVLI